jgi:hypothetical protein
VTDPTLDDCDQPTDFARTLLRRSELKTLPKVEPLIDGVMSLRASVVLFGPTGAGKTLVGLSQACCIGTGNAWLGSAVRKLPVLYVIGEGASGLDDRVRAFELFYGVEVDDEAVIFSVKPASLNLPQTWAEIRAEAHDLGRRVVFFDTFSSLAHDADETKDAASFTRRLSDLAAAIDGTAVVVHHPGWSDQDRTRGGYQLEANVDEVLKLSGNAHSPVVQLSRKKVKEGAAGAVLWLRRKEIDLGRYDDKGRAVTSVTVDLTTATEAVMPMRDLILQVLDDMGDTGATGPQLLKMTGTPDHKRSTLYAALRKLVDAGEIKKEGTRGHENYRRLVGQ